MSATLKARLDEFTPEYLRKIVAQQQAKPIDEFARHAANVFLYQLVRAQGIDDYADELMASERGIFGHAGFTKLTQIAYTLQNQAKTTPNSRILDQLEHQALLSPSYAQYGFSRGANNELLALATLSTLANHAIYTSLAHDTQAYMVARDDLDFKDAFALGKICSLFGEDSATAGSVFSANLSRFFGEALRRPDFSHHTVNFQNLSSTAFHDGNFRKKITRLPVERQVCPARAHLQKENMIARLERIHAHVLDLAYDGTLPDEIINFLTEQYPEGNITAESLQQAVADDYAKTVPC